MMNNEMIGHFLYALWEEYKEKEGIETEELSDEDAELLIRILGLFERRFKLEDGFVARAGGYSLQIDNGRLYACDPITRVGLVSLDAKERMSLQLSFQGVKCCLENIVELYWKKRLEEKDEHERQ